VSTAEGWGRQDSVATAATAEDGDMTTPTSLNQRREGAPANKPSPTTPPKNGPGEGWLNKFEPIPLLSPENNPSAEPASSNLDELVKDTGIVSRSGSEVSSPTNQPSSQPSSLILPTTTPTIHAQSNPQPTGTLMMELENALLENAKSPQKHGREMRLVRLDAKLIKQRDIPGPGAKSLVTQRQQAAMRRRIFLGKARQIQQEPIGRLKPARDRYEPPPFVPPATTIRDADGNSWVAPWQTFSSPRRRRAQSPSVGRVDGGTAALIDKRGRRENTPLAGVGRHVGFWQSVDSSDRSPKGTRPMPLKETPGKLPGRTDPWGASRRLFEPTMACLSDDESEGGSPQKLPPLWSDLVTSSGDIPSWRRHRDASPPGRSGQMLSSSARGPKASGLQEERGGQERPIKETMSGMLTGVGLLSHGDDPLPLGPWNLRKTMSGTMTERQGSPANQREQLGHTAPHPPTQSKEMLASPRRFGAVSQPVDTKGLRLGTFAESTLHASLSVGGFFTAR